MISLSYTKKSYSDKEFLRLIDRRVKQNAKGLNPYETIILEASERDFKLAKALLGRIFKEPEVNMAESEIKALSFEEEATIALKHIQNAQIPKKIKNILSRITEEEIIHLCRILKINNDKPEIHPFLHEIMKKHPDTAFGFSQALEALNDS